MLCPDTLRAVRKWKLMDLRLKFQLTSALLSTVGGRRAKFEEISDAGITSMALIRVSKRPFFLASHFGVSGCRQGSSGCSVLLTQTWPNQQSFPLNHEPFWWHNAQFYLFMLDWIDIEFKDRLLIVLVQQSVLNTAAFSIFIFFDFLLSFLSCDLCEWFSSPAPPTVDCSVSQSAAL